MKAYSPEFRRDVLAACDANEGTRAVALRFGVSESWVRRVKQERRELGKVTPIRTRKRTPKWLAEADRIRQAIDEKPDRTLVELKAYLKTPLSIQTLSRALRELKLTFKKKSWSPRNKTVPTSPRSGKNGDPTS
jgi:transposase